ncbi:MAG: N-6 DNA methylase [Ignavibacteriae bacterium]|nr:N-6 DNA methylase [Ignavibacteriota bacterium]
MHSLESAFNTIKELVEDFRQNEKRFLSPQYQEAEVRRDFIDKFFEALGWDVYHKSQKNPYEQEVKVEKGVSVGKAQKRADYAFYIAPEFRVPKFFTEAKKPCRNLKNADDYFQTVRYGWNANTPIAVLTDFEELHILDCRFKPDINTVLNNDNHKRYHYTDYAEIEKFKEIYFLLSRDAVADNSLTKYSESFPKPKGKYKAVLKGSYQAIDDDFLEYIDEVRETLAKAFKKNDTKLSSEELTEATQRTIDRLVFIRFLEDKLIEPDYYISEFGKKGNTWSDFISTCRQLDAKYNGIVFKKHFIDGQDFRGPENITFKKICDEMSYLNSPYDFNAIPIHILGSIYERFLGKVVNATAQRVKIEEKPEVRKAGGVYYTPKYIVDYIVDNTVGKILRNEDSLCHSGESRGYPLGHPESTNTDRAGKLPDEISKLRFADIACGSGSFLIGVFETLLKYHTEYYQSHTEKAKKDGCILKEGQWILSIKQKQKILLNNIYGVDIDQQATEVTQLSLALKMLEDESTATANDMQVLFHEKILPDLSKNIICGNSLIGTDILDGKMFATDEERKLNPMDFEKRFPEIMKSGGFDAIVGNPPYGLIGSDRKTEQEYLNNKYKFLSYKTNLYIAFLESAIKYLKIDSGKLGYIIPKSLVFNTYFNNARFMLLKYFIEEIIEIREKVFKSAETGDSILILINNSKSDENTKLRYMIVENIYPIYQLIKTITNYNYKLLKSKDAFFINNNFELKANCVPLHDICKISNGLNPGNIRHLLLFDSSKSEKYKELILGRDIQRYSLKWSGTWVNYDIGLKENINLSDTKSKKGMIAQPKVDFALRDPAIFLPDKLLIRKTADRVIAVKDNYGYYYDSLSHGVQLLENDKYSLNYILALLNSKIINFIHSSISQNINKVFAKVLITNLQKLPIKAINFHDQSEKQSHDSIVTLVDQMLETKKQLQAVKTDKDKTYYENKCADLDRAIDEEVYSLYGLTEEEIKIVEGKE